MNDLRVRPFLVFADSQGQIYAHPRLRMLCGEWASCRFPQERELIVKTDATALFVMPGRFPVGYDPVTGQAAVLREFEGRPVQAVAAFLPPSYLRTAHPAIIAPSDAAPLPLWAYTAVGSYGGQFKVAAMRVDARTRQLPYQYADTKTLEKNIVRICKAHPHNRLFPHFARCAREYGCLNGKNLFYGRWEAPLAVSNVCNARCVGCLSMQEEKELCSPHQRLDFVPTAEELAELALFHIKNAREPLVSFGQGCEGEPLLRADLIAETIRLVRAKTHKGSIHVNSNAGYTDGVATVAKAGLDSLRVSLNSAIDTDYATYFRPKGYTLGDVRRSIDVAKRHGVFVSLNLFMYPGFTDRMDQAKALFSFVKKHKVDMILLRNLNIDAVLMHRLFGVEEKKAMGMRAFVQELRERFVNVRLGYFNVPARHAGVSTVQRKGL
jgi:molybdenum cofactor biosynthesis enzyme MoaA